MVNSVLKFCWCKKQYYVRTDWKFRYGGWSNYIATPSLARARMLNQKLKVKHRQIDVRIKGRKPYVLEGSWK